MGWRAACPEIWCLSSPEKFRFLFLKGRTLSWPRKTSGLHRFSKMAAGDCTPSLRTKKGSPFRRSCLGGLAQNSRSMHRLPAQQPRGRTQTLPLWSFVTPTSPHPEPQFPPQGKGEVPSHLPTFTQLSA